MLRSLALLAVLLSFVFAGGAYAQGGHGVGVQAICLGPQCELETTECLFVVSYNDQFGDTTAILEAFDVVDPEGAAIRVPAAPDSLNIESATGNTTAVPGPFGGVILIGPAGSTLNGLPGIPIDGEVVFTQNIYVIQEGDPDPLPHRASFLVMDLCDDPDTQGCSSLPALLQFPAATDIVHPQIMVEKSADPARVCEGVDTSVDFTFTVTNIGDIGLENVELVDSLCGIVAGPDSGDVNGNSILDLDETWIYTCTEIINSTTMTSVTVSGEAEGETADCIDTDTLEFEIPGNPPPTCEIIGDDAVCVGGTLMFTGPPDMASYSWSTVGGCGTIVGPADQQMVTIQFPNTGPCTVQLSVTDQNGCDEGPCSLVVTVHPEPPCSITPPAGPNCEGGSGTFTGPAGLAGYLWETTCGTIVGPNDQQSVTIMFGTAGPCTVTLTTTSGTTPPCVNECQIDFTVDENPTANPDNATVCEGGSAQICANPTGGSGNYACAWTGPGGPIAGTDCCITVSTAGQYCVVVTDTDTGCMSPEACGTLTVTPNPPCTITPPTTPICAGGQGVFTGPGGAGLTYLWSTDCGTIIGPNNQQSVTIEFGAAGDCMVNLTVTVPGQPPCETSCMIPVTINDPPSATPNTAAFCEGSFDEISANPTGGSGSYSCAWEGPSGPIPGTDCTITVTEGGVYCVVVTDTVTGCMSAEACSAAVEIIETPDCEITPPTTPICEGGQGVFTGPAGVEWAWSTDCGTIIGPSNQQTVTIEFGAAGDCTVSLMTTTPGTTCTNMCEIPVTVNENPTADPNDATVCEGGTAEICANATGGSGDYSCAWTGPGGPIAGTDCCISVTAAGQYCVVVTDNVTGCVSAEACGTLSATPAPPCTITPPDQLCVGTIVTFVGPAGDFTYAWSTTCGNIIGPADQQSVDIELTAVGPCTVTLTTTDNTDPTCTSTCVLDVTVGETPTADPPDLVVCVGEGGEICANASGGVQPYTYLWTGPGGFESTDECITPTVEGTYCVIVTDASGCASDSACAEYDEREPPDVTIIPPPEDPPCEEGGNALRAEIIGGREPFEITWSVDGPNWEITGGQGTLNIEYTTGDQDSCATFTVLVIDANDCMDMYQLEVCCGICIPVTLECEAVCIPPDPGCPSGSSGSSGPSASGSVGSSSSGDPSSASGSSGSSGASGS
ncbi:MAG: DUF7507 domain-containing protein, partial [Planctomycetota bacterium]